MRFQKLIILRRISQVFFLMAFIYILWSTTYPLKGLISPQVLFKMDPLLMLLTMLSQKMILSGVLFSAVMIVLTLVLGRFFCGWVCPMGTVIDGFGFFRRRSRKRFSDVQRQKISLPKFFILGGMLLSAFFGLQVAWTLDPIATAGRVVSLNVIPGVTLAVDKIFQFGIQQFGWYGGFYDVYRSLKEGILSVNVHFFSNSVITLLFFLLVTGAGCLVTRLWCRMFCPLGAFYAALSYPALLARKVNGCTSCGICSRNCRMGAIKEDASYRKGECILCMDCIYDCKFGATEFSFGRTKGKKGAKGERGREKGEKQGRSGDQGISRQEFLFLLTSVFASLGFSNLRPSPLAPRSSGHPVIRPPAALPEQQFVNVCVRCGNCMKVCVTNGLQPVMLESGAQGIWTPKLVPEIGWCEYNCTLCGEVCPTQAIGQLALPAKQKAKLGVAKIDHTICLAWAENKECIVCEEHCPVSDKAIKLQEDFVNAKRIPKPIVDSQLCIGCGICQNKCPVRPLRAIRVDPA